MFLGCGRKPEKKPHTLGEYANSIENDRRSNQNQCTCCSTMEIPHRMANSNPGTLTLSESELKLFLSSQFAHGDSGCCCCTSFTQCVFDELRSAWSLQTHSKGFKPVSNNGLESLVISQRPPLAPPSPLPWISVLHKSLQTNVLMQEERDGQKW